MNNQTGINVLSAALFDISHKYVTHQDPSVAINVKDLHKLLMKGCYKLDTNSEYIIPESAVSRGIVTLRGTIIIYVEISPKQIKEYPINQSATIKDLKDIICDEEGISPSLQRLLFVNQELKDNKSLKYYNIKERDTVQLTLKIIDGFFLLPKEIFDEPYHYDFTNISDEGNQFYRGRMKYLRPCGWQRYALKVKGEYADDIWLEGEYRRSDKYSSAEGEWAVSYHGTSYHNGLSIAKEGFRLSRCTRFKYGYGIYTTPYIEVAYRFADIIQIDGITYRFVVQSRVNPKNVKIVSKAETGVGEFWISSNEDDVRPYGYCLREIGRKILPLKLTPTFETLPPVTPLPETIKLPLLVVVICCNNDILLHKGMKN